MGTTTMIPHKLMIRDGSVDVRVCPVESNVVKVVVKVHKLFMEPLFNQMPHCLQCTASCHLSVGVVMTTKHQHQTELIIE